MFLYLRNLYRRIRGKPPVTNLVFEEENFKPSKDIFEDLASSHKEVVMICVEHPRHDKLSNTNVKCHVKVSDKSILLPMLNVVADKIISGDYTELDG